MDDFDEEVRRAFDLDSGLRAAIERNRIGGVDTGTDDCATEIDLHPAYTNLIAADDELALLLSGHIAVAGQD